MMIEEKTLWDHLAYEPTAAEKRADALLHARDRRQAQTLRQRIVLLRRGEVLAVESDSEALILSPIEIRNRVARLDSATGDDDGAWLVEITNRRTGTIEHVTPTDYAARINLRTGAIEHVAPTDYAARRGND